MLEDSANAPSDVPSGFTPPHAAAPEFDAGASTTESSTFAQLGPDVVITPSRPRVWTSIVVGLGAPVFAIIAGSVVVIIAMAMSMGFAGMQQRDKVVQWVSEIASNPLGLAALIIPSQLMFLCGAVGTAALSRERIASRLAIRRGIMPAWTYPLLMLATLAVGMIGGMASLLSARGRSSTA